MAPDVSERRPKLWFYRLAQVVLFIFYRICFRLEAYGRENVPQDSRGVILAPNHASYLDPPILGVTLARHITYLAKEYLFKVPVFGTVLFWLGAIPIKSEADDFRSMRQLLRALKNGKQILIFPEGTRSLDGNFKSVEAGVGFLAVKSQAHVVPVYIKGTFQAFPKGVKWFKNHPVKIYYGKPFIPALEPELLNKPDPYLAVSEKIMAEIAKIKESVEKN